MAWTAPRTWVAGEKVTAAIMNLHVRDNLKYLGDTAGWVVPTLLNSWLAFGAPFDAPSYQKFGPYVLVKGSMKSGTTAATVFTLPAGMRPLNSRLFLAPSGGAGSSARIGITSGGVVTVDGYGTGANNGLVSLDGIAFLAEQ